MSIHSRLRRRLRNLSWSRYLNTHQLQRYIVFVEYFPYKLKEIYFWVSTSDNFLLAYHYFHNSLRQGQKLLYLDTTHQQLEIWQAYLEIWGCNKCYNVYQFTRQDLYPVHLLLSLDVKKLRYASLLVLHAIQLLIKKVYALGY